MSIQSGVCPILEQPPSINTVSMNFLPFLCPHGCLTPAMGGKEWFLLPVSYNDHFLQQVPAQVR